MGGEGGGWGVGEKKLFNTSFFFFFGYSEFKLVTKEICKLPSFFSSALFRKIDMECTGIVNRSELTCFPGNN